MLNIYVASSWRNAVQPLVVEALREAGHEVYDFRHPAPDDDGFSWDQIDPAWKGWTPLQYWQALEHPLAAEGFKKDSLAMAAANACVLVLPCGASAHLEAGWMIGQGKPVCIFMPIPSEPELMYKFADGLVLKLPELIKWAKEYDVQPTGYEVHVGPDRRPAKRG